MASKPKTTGGKKKAPAGFITKAQLDQKLDKLMDGILGAVDSRLAKAATSPETVVAETKAAAAVEKAGPDKFQVNPEWEEDAKNVLGDALDHTEVVYERNGGIKYTVVLKKEFSNAPQQYLELTGSDRRTKEVGAGGFGAVQEWNKLIKQNISKPGRDMRAPAAK